MKLFVAYTHNKDTKMAEEEGNINLNCQEPVTLVLGSAISERSFWMTYISRFPFSENPFRHTRIYYGVALFEIFRLCLDSMKEPFATDSIIFIKFYVCLDWKAKIAQNEIFALHHIWGKSRNALHLYAC